MKKKKRHDGAYIETVTGMLRPATFRSELSSRVEISGGGAIIRRVRRRKRPPSCTMLVNRHGVILFFQTIYRARVIIRFVVAGRSRGDDARCNQ